MGWKEEETEKREREEKQKALEEVRLNQEKFIITQKVGDFWRKLVTANDTLPAKIRLLTYSSMRIGDFQFDGSYIILHYQYGGFISYDIDKESICLIKRRITSLLIFLKQIVGDYYYIDEDNIDILLRNACTGRPIISDLKFAKTESAERIFKKFHRGV